ncbi:MAG: DUF262 domain-containing protein [Anaerolineaceae bacterium]|nr:DUF262 domain-containing protein [Anaerolineaceae bacterium]
MKVEEILYEVDHGKLAIPVFQRGFEWPQDKILKYLRSMYMGYPAGGLLTWTTGTDKRLIRGAKSPPDKSATFIVDGQQRITTLYVIARGEFPEFFIGNKSRLQDIYFDLENEKFFYYRKEDIKDHLLWVPVGEVLREGPRVLRRKIRDSLKGNGGESDDYDRVEKYIDHLEDLQEIMKREFHISRLYEEKFSIDDVVDIFVQVNSGSKRLTGGELALAKLSAMRPEARDDLNRRLNKWGEAGFHFSVDWLLRCINAGLTGRAKFEALDSLTSKDFVKGLDRVESHIDNLIHLLQTKLGIDNDELLGMRACFPLLTHLLEISGGEIDDDRVKAKMLYWYIQTVIHQRYYGGTEAVLQRDLNALRMDRTQEENLDHLILSLHREGIESKYTWPESYGAGKNRHFQLLYILSRVYVSRDIFTNDPLGFGQFNNPLEKHHIIPNSILKKLDWPQKERNDVANFAFLTRKANRTISNSPPSEYLQECENKYKGILSTQWIPSQSRFWKQRSYSRFLAERRKLLTKAVNRLLSDLKDGRLPDV